jgi:hypothetical protein
MITNLTIADAVIVEWGIGSVSTAPGAATIRIA